jgi:hypothetical protein
MPLLAPPPAVTELLGVLSRAIAGCLRRPVLQEALDARSQLRSELGASMEERTKLGQQVQALAGELARHRDALQQEKLTAASLQVGAAGLALAAGLSICWTPGFRFHRGRSNSLPALRPFV